MKTAAALVVAAAAALQPAAPRRAVHTRRYGFFEDLFGSDDPQKNAAKDEQWRIQQDVLKRRQSTVHLSQQELVLQIRCHSSLRGRRHEADGRSLRLQTLLLSTRDVGLLRAWHHALGAMPPDVMPRRRRVMPRREMPRHPSVITLDGDITPMAWCHAACYHAPLAWRHAKTAVEMLCRQ